MQYLAILGRQPALGLAELESLYGAESVKPVGREAALLEIEPNQLQPQRLGGTIKLAKLLNRLETIDWRAVEKYLAETVPEHMQYVPEGKFKLGLSAYDLHVSTQELNTSGLKLKKIIKTTGRNVRIIPNKTAELNSAQVLHNQLTSSTGWELLAVRDGNTTLLAQTVFVQDIEAYAARDQARPKRDAKVGMLPPKLAQIIINLAAGMSGADDPDTPLVILDPFCGTGVVLQEALLIGYNVYGTDLEPRMAEFAEENVHWLRRKVQRELGQSRIEPGDATKHHWQAPIDFVAAETYLGRPFSALPPMADLNRIVKQVDDLHFKFLKNIHAQLKPGAQLALAVPAWKTPGGFMHLPVLDRLTDMGYNRIRFIHADNEDLVYHREGQIVGRKLVVLQRK